ncbi:MAG: TetR/AcrR family transcriptional regulator [Actinomycetota bacterium]|nr:TetR/AcrR family transcriptional regulator [Actinomycetota bacterium]
MAVGEARQRLLDAAIDHVAGSGLTDLSLRRLAQELGTSHRMLIHHFGSKEGLWVAIVREVERRQLAALADLAPDPSLSFAEATRAWWRHISQPSLWPNERLFFEVYGQALHGREPAVELLDGVVDAWLEPTAELAERMGLPPATARAFARLGIAVTRGLLLDLLATGDRDGVDAAMEHWIALNAPLFEAARPAGEGSRSA